MLDKKMKEDEETKPVAVEPAGESVREKDKLEVRIFDAWCKGCGICVAFCPKSVLEMNTSTQKAFVANPQNCVQCGLCEIRCPDLAIKRIVKRKEATNGKK